jgi:hypothetical protein
MNQLLTVLDRAVYETPILQSRAPDATKKQHKIGQDRSGALNQLSSKFMLRRTADVIAKFLPPKRKPFLARCVNPSMAS